MFAKDVLRIIDPDPDGLSGFEFVVRELAAKRGLAQYVTDPESKCKGWIWAVDLEEI